MDNTYISQVSKSTAQTSLLGFLGFLTIFPGSVYFVFTAQVIPFAFTALLGEILFLVTFYLENKIAKKHQIQWKMKEIMSFLLVMLFFALAGSGIAFLLNTLYGINAKVLGVVFPILAGNWMLSFRKKKSSNSMQEIVQLNFSYHMSWLIGAYILVTLLLLVFLIGFSVNGF